MYRKSKIPSNINIYCDKKTMNTTNSTKKFRIKNKEKNLPTKKMKIAKEKYSQKNFRSQMNKYAHIFKIIISMYIYIVFLLPLTFHLNIYTESQLENINQIMSFRSMEKQHYPITQTYKANKMAYFAYNLYRQPNNPHYLAAEYHNYNKKYRISEVKEQKPLCVVAVGHNNNHQHMIERFIDSIVRQNYTNYHVVYSVDHSNDLTSLIFYKYLQQYYPDYIHKFTLITHPKRSYALFNRDYAIRNQCEIDDIILDMDSDDALIGNQVFKLINAIYTDEVWLAYTTHIKIDFNTHEPVMGICQAIPDELLQDGKYRVSDQWVTSQLRTFRRKLYKKIDQNDFLDASGGFRQWASDRYTLYPMIEMAGKEHIRYIQEPTYYYDLGYIRKRTDTQIIPHIMWAKMLTPYLPLSSLDEHSVRMPNYNPPVEIVLEYKEAVEKSNKRGWFFQNPPL